MNKILKSDIYKWIKSLKSLKWIIKVKLKK